MTWIITNSGKKMDFENIDPKSICAKDIAKALSKICRFSGHTNKFYSVADHVINGAHYMIANDYAYQQIQTWLLHDAAEAYVNDLPSPLKKIMRDNGSHVYDTVEDNLMTTICYKLCGSMTFEYSDIKNIDVAMLHLEMKHLFDQNQKLETFYLELKTTVEIPAHFCVSGRTFEQSENDLLYLFLKYGISV